MSNKPLVSIILPVYNVEDYIRECLDSIFLQNYPHLEVIAVNDGSTDGSHRILEEYQRMGRAITILDQPNRGLSAARNAGINAANGEFVMFVDSDDRIDPCAVKRCVEFANAENLDAVTFDAESFGNNGIDERTDAGSFKKKVEGGVYTGELLFEKLLSQGGTWVCAPLFFFKRTFLIETDLRFYEGILHEDVEFTPRALVKLNRIGILNEVFYFYRRLRAGAITTDISKDASERQQLAICNKLYSESGKPDCSPTAKDLLERFLMQRHQMLLSGTTKSPKREGLRRGAAFRILRSLLTKSRLRSRLSIGKRITLVSTYVLPEAKPVLEFISSKVIGPFRRTFRYQVLPRLRRWRS